MSTGSRRAFADGARALLLCSPHNPAGSVPTREQLEALAEAAVRHDAWVLADEIHAPLTLPGTEHVPFLEVSDAARERGIGLSSASKTFNIAGLVCARDRRRQRCRLGGRRSGSRSSTAIPATSASSDRSPPSRSPAPTSGSTG